MVVVPKKNSETVRICVDFRPLNECVLREICPLPKVEETLAQLSGATVFMLTVVFGRFRLPNTPGSTQHL